MENKKLARLSYAASFLAVLLIVFRYRQLFRYTANGGGHYDYYLLGAVSIFGFFFFVAIWQKVLCPIWRNLDNASRLDGVFCVCVLVLLLFPISRLNMADKDATENRKLATFPVLWGKDGKVNSDFGSGVEKWLSDRISGRKKLLLAHNKLDGYISGERAETERAFAGKDDWLFYINVADGNSLKLFQNRLLFTKAELVSIHKNIEQQHAWLASHRASYVIFIAPNKEDVYSEYYPDGIHKLAPLDRVSLLQEYLQKQPNSMHIVYPLSDLLLHKQDGLLYYKNDTHWSPLGAYWGYRALMSEIQKVLPDINVLSLEDCEITQSTKAYGDLLSMLPSVDRVPYQSVNYEIPVPIAGKQYSEEKARESQPRIHTVNPNGKYKAIVFRDSFSSALIPYVSESFHEVLYIWTHNLDSYADLIRQEQPDIVIHEMVSRYAGSLTIPTPHWSEERESR